MSSLLHFRKAWIRTADETNFSIEALTCPYTTPTKNSPIQSIILLAYLFPGKIPHLQLMSCST